MTERYSNSKHYNINKKSILIILLSCKLSTNLHCSHNTNYADCQNYQNALYITYRSIYPDTGNA